MLCSFQCECVSIPIHVHVVLSTTGLHTMCGTDVCPASPFRDRAATAQWRTLERANEVAKETEILLSSADQPAEQITFTCRLLPYIHATWYNTSRLQAVRQYVQELIHVRVRVDATDTGTCTDGIPSMFMSMYSYVQCSMYVRVHVHVW